MRRPCPHAQKRNLQVRDLRNVEVGVLGGAPVTVLADQRPAAILEPELASLIRIGVVAVLSIEIALDRVADLVDRSPRNYAAVADEPDQAPGGKRTAGKAEDVQLVSGLVIEHEEPVGLLDVLGQPKAEHTGQETIDPEEPVAAITGADSLVVVDDLHDAVPIDSPDRAGNLGHVGRVRHVDGVPGAIEAKHDPFHASSSPKQYRV